MPPHDFFPSKGGVDRGKPGGSRTVYFWQCPKCFCQNTFYKGTDKDPAVAPAIVCGACKETYRTVRRDGFRGGGEGG